MPLSCFAGGRGGDSPAKASSATSVYWTHLGAITLSWSRAALGLVLTVDIIGLSGAATPARFVLLPLLPWRRRGSKRFSGALGRSVAFSWDLSRARLAPRRPEPLSGYFVLVSVDGELALAAGDLKSSSPMASAGLLLSRRENAYPAGCGGAYTTTVAVAGEEHEVSLAVEEAAMWVAVDGKRALQVRRLRWKFRGSERLDLPRGGRSVRVTWDLHGWLFAADAAAVFVLRFDADGASPAADDNDTEEDDVGMHALRQNSFSFRSRRADSSSGEGDTRGSWRRGPFRSGSDSSPTVSVASTSAASSSAGSVATVAEWATAEEAELRDGGGGFSLVIHLWKKRRPR